ncbi:hypothetical protein [Polymorphobacter sp.]|uniref:hypothetical protein n=1 Tax=Polymorphobacter sp. TaxID=1909290 RepID=UPI003F6F3243
MKLRLGLITVFATLGLAAAVGAADLSVYAGLSGATLLDSGSMVVAAGGPSAREEAFEYLQRPDGGHVLLNTITAADGKYRVQARFDLDKDWRSENAYGIGLYDGKPVDVVMRLAGREVKISVRPRDAALGGLSSDPVAVCDPDCFINMSPSITSMFVMTRHYDFARGGAQTFRWTGQDLDRVRTLSGGTATLSFKGEVAATRAGGASMAVRHFTFVERMPDPKGGTYSLNFDMWTDTEHRPLGFKIVFNGGNPSGVVGWRKGYEDVRAVLIPPR